MEKKNQCPECGECREVNLIRDKYGITTCMTCGFTYDRTEALARENAQLREALGLADELYQTWELHGENDAATLIALHKFCSQYHLVTRG